MSNCARSIGRNSIPTLLADDSYSSKGLCYDLLPTAGSVAVLRGSVTFACSKINHARSGPRAPAALAEATCEEALREDRKEE